MLKKVVSYSVGLYAATLFAALTRVLLKSFVAKMMGKEALGAYAFFASILQIGTSLLAFGLTYILAKHVAASKEEADYGPVVGVFLALLTGLSVVLAGSAFLVRPYLNWVWVLVLVSVGPATLLLLGRAVLRGQFDRNRDVIAGFVAVAAQAIGVVLMVLLLDDPQSPVIGVAAASVLVGIGMVAYFIWRYPAWWKPRRLFQHQTLVTFRRLLGLASPLWIAAILETIGSQADRLVVQGRLGYLSLAEYAAAFTFIGLLDQPLAVLSRVFLVTFANDAYTEVEQYRRVLSLNLVFISTMGLTVSILSVFFTPIVFTDEYQMTPMLVTILSTAFVFKAVEVFNTALTIAKDYPQANRNAKFWSTGLYLPLAFFLVLRFDVVGAAWGQVAFWGGYALIHALYMRRRLPGHAASSLRQMLVATVLYVGLTWATWWLNLGWFALLAVPLYLLLGQVLRLWDLMLVPSLVRRLLTHHPETDGMGEAESPNVSN